MRRMSAQQARSFVAKELLAIRTEAHTLGLNTPLGQKLSCPPHYWMGSTQDGFHPWHRLVEQEWKAGFAKGQEDRRQDLRQVCGSES